MTQDISGFGLVATVIGSITFPAGFQVTQFADDSDPLDLNAIRIADTAMGLNGDLISWSKAVPLPMVLNVIPGSPDDLNLGVLAEANRVGKGKVIAYDVVTATILYPDGTSITMSGGKIVEAMFGKSVSGPGRMKTKSYGFQFQNKVGF